MASARKFGKRVDGISGQRTSPREDVSVAISMFTVDQSRVVILIDISTRGARIQGHTLPAKGADVWLKLGRYDAFGRVVWSTRNQCGITFEEPLEEDQLREVIASLHWEPPHVVNNRRLYDLH